jgi:hypothetical protein
MIHGSPRRSSYYIELLCMQSVGDNPMLMLCACRGGFFTGVEFIDMLNEVRHLRSASWSWKRSNMAAGGTADAAQPMLTPTWVPKNQF